MQKGQVGGRREGREGGERGEREEWGGEERGGEGRRGAKSLKGWVGGWVGSGGMEMELDWEESGLVLVLVMVSVVGRKHRIREWREDCWARFFAWFTEHNLQRLKSMHEDSTEGEEMKRQQRIEIMKDMTKKIRSKGGMDADNR